MVLSAVMVSDDDRGHPNRVRAEGVDAQDLIEMNRESTVEQKFTLPGSPGWLISGGPALPECSSMDEAGAGCAHARPRPHRMNAWSQRGSFYVTHTYII